MLMIEKTAEGCYKVISACKGRYVEEDKSILINNQANRFKKEENEDDHNKRLDLQIF